MIDWQARLNVHELTEALPFQLVTFHVNNPMECSRRPRKWYCFASKWTVMNRSSREVLWTNVSPSIRTKELVRLEAF